MNLEIDLRLPIFQKGATRQEVAEYVDTEVYFIDREIKRGNLNASKFNKKVVRIFPGDLVRWIERAQASPEALRIATEPRRGRGRPRKNPVIVAPVVAQEEVQHERVTT